MFSATQEITVDSLMDALAALPRSVKDTFEIPEGPSPSLPYIRERREWSSLLGRRCPLCVLADEMVGTESGYLGDGLAALEFALGRSLSDAEVVAAGAVMNAADGNTDPLRARMIEALS